MKGTWVLRSLNVNVLYHLQYEWDTQYRHIARWISYRRLKADITVDLLSHHEFIPLWVLLWKTHPLPSDNILWQTTLRSGIFLLKMKSPKENACLISWYDFIHHVFLYRSLQVWGLPAWAYFTSPLVWCIDKRPLPTKQGLSIYNRDLAFDTYDPYWSQQLDDLL